MEVWNEVTVVICDSAGALMRGLRAQDVHSLSVHAEPAPRTDKVCVLHILRTPLMSSVEGKFCAALTWFRNTIVRCTRTVQLHTRAHLV